MTADEMILVSIAEERDELRRQLKATRAVAVAGIHHAHVMDRRDMQQRRQIEHLREEVRRLRSNQATTGCNPRRTNTTRAA